MSEHIDISLAVKTLMLNHAPLAALVGSNVFIDQLPQGVKTGSVVMWVVTERATMHLGGQTGLDQARIQVNAYGNTRAEANEIAWTIKQAADAWLGVSEEVHILGCARASGIRYSTDRVEVGTDIYRFVATQDLLFTYDSITRVS